MGLSKPTDPFVFVSPPELVLPPVGEAPSTEVPPGSIWYGFNCGLMRILMRYKRLFIHFVSKLSINFISCDKKYAS